jgi:putative ABC transport system permease protein
MSGFNWIDTLLRDLRYGTRMLARSPVFTSVALLSLGLGIGANTALFSVMDALLLKMLPVKDPQQLVQLRSQISFPAFQKVLARNQAFSGAFAYTYMLLLPSASVRIGSEPEQASGVLASGDYFSVLGVDAVAGRTFTANDDSIPGTGGPQGPVAVISYPYWERRFTLDPAVIGKTITVNSVPVTIVGVTPPHFFGTNQSFSPDITLPMMLQPRTSASASTELWVHGDKGSMLSYDLTDQYGPSVIARLKSGVSTEQAQTQLNVLYQQILTERAGGKPDEAKRRENLEKRLELAPAGNGYAGWDPGMRAVLLVIMVAVPALVLLIACANVANLLLARAAARQKEVAVRLAIGAGRGRLIRQFLTESMLLGIGGGALGLAMASGFRRLILNWLTANINVPFHLAAETDMRVLGFTAAISLAAALVFGLAPAFRAVRAELAPMLKDGARLSGGGGWETGKALVVAQVGLSLLLLICAGLLLQTLRNLRLFDPGFKRANLYATWTEFQGGRPGNGPMVKELTRRMENLPGATASAVTFNYPSGGFSGARFKISVDGRNPVSGDDAYVNRLLVGPGVFKTMGLQLLSGRQIEARDDENAPKVCLLSATVARLFFAGQNPVGRRFKFERTAAESTAEIIGVVQDVKNTETKDKLLHAVYCPVLQDLPLGDVSVLVRIPGDPTATLTELRRQFQEFDRNLFLQVRSLDDWASADLLLQRFFATLASAFGALALLLATAGLYGVMAYSVSRRTIEIGIRMAVGAGQGSVIRMVVRETMKLVAIGIVIGLLSALAATRLVANALFGVKPTDPITIGIAVFVMIAVTLIAGYAPARRAASVDPMIALRHE